MARIGSELISGSIIKMDKQKRRNDCLRLLDSSFRIDINSVRINTHNRIFHEVAKLILAYNEIKKGHQVVIEARFKGGGIADILVLDTFDKDKIYYINVLLNLTMLCDCWGFSTPSLVPDIGIMASNDIAAIDKASLDMIKAENLLPDSLPEGRELTEGKHLFEKIFGKDPYNQIKILEEMKIGNGDYEFEEID